MKEICTLLVKLHIIFSRMQRVNQHARPSIIQVGCPTCCYQVCELDHANVGTADLDYSSGHWHRNGLNVGPMLQLWPHPWPGPWIFNVKFWNCCIPGMAGSINMEKKGCESIGCYTYFVTLSYDLDLGFSRSNFKNAVSREWEGRLTWNQRDVSR